MKKRLLIGIVVLLIAIDIALFVIRPVLGGFVLGALVLIGVWLYLQYSIRQTETDNKAAAFADSLVKRLKIFLAISGISLVVGVIGIILHNALYGLSEIEEPASFLIAIVGLFLFVVVTIGCLIAYLINRGKITHHNAGV